MHDETQPAEGETDAMDESDGTEDEPMLAEDPTISIADADALRALEPFLSASLPALVPGVDAMLEQVLCLMRLLNALNAYVVCVCGSVCGTVDVSMALWWADAECGYGFGCGREGGCSCMRALVAPRGGGVGGGGCEAPAAIHLEQP